MFSYIARRVQNKLENWYTKFLSPAGKEVLIKSVAIALPTYCMSCFLLPTKITAQITGCIRRYWWSTSKDKQKLPWIAWSKMTKLKQYGGMGFRDLNHFNIALLAKQSWRLLKDPQSLLARVLKAKYYANSNLFEANLGHRPSHAWRSIFQGTFLLKQGIQWRVGNGNTINVWHDQWIDNPPRPAKPLHCNISNKLKVSGLMKQHSNLWDDQKLQDLIHPADINLIKRIRPRITVAPDTPIWIFTNTGQYTVKSGYHQLLKSSLVQLLETQTFNRLCKSIWKLSIPPKVKHFWWKILHNAIPVAGALASRRIKVPRDCVLCGEMEESVLHLLFHCRVSKEIWELSPLEYDICQFSDTHSIISSKT